MSAKQTLAPQSPTPTSTPTASTAWRIDPSHSQAEFSVRHLMISNVKGTIPIRKAEIVRDEHDITKSSVYAELDLAGIDTGAKDRDAHLRSPDFFDVANHPTITFQSTRVEGKGDELLVIGQLAIRGVAREVVLAVDLLGEARDPWGGTRAGAVATTTIDRRDFGLTWNVAIEAGGVLVGDKVKITLNLEAVKAN